MGIGLSNVKLSVGKSPSEYVQKVNKARPSIAEDAIFIPKPQKRVSFEMVKPISNGARGEKEIPLPGSSSEAGDVPLPGDGSKGNSGGGNKVDVTGIPDKLPALGENGVSAKLTDAQYSGEPTEGYVKMKIDYVPEKDHKWDAPQEEGRQINNRQVPFQLQYDSYGRPRIGFSREPYDFAATKYIQLTSQIKFDQNIGKTKEHFEQYFIGDNTSEEEMKALFAVGGNDSTTPSDPPPLIGEGEDGKKSGDKKDIKLFGDNSDGKEVSDGQIKDKKEFEQLFFNNNSGLQEKEIEQMLFGKGVSSGENKGDDNSGESVTKSESAEGESYSTDSGFKTHQYELTSNSKTEGSQFSLRV